MKKLAYTYESQQGETVEEIIHRHYGSHYMQQRVFNANPGLAKRGPVLPTGVKIILPAEPVTERQYITLW